MCAKVNMPDAGLEMDAGHSMTPGGDVKPPAVYILPAPDAPRVWGLSPAERLRRALAKLPVDRVLSQGDPWPETGTVVLLRGDVVYDDSVLDGVIARPGIAMARTAASGEEPLGAHVDAASAPAAADWLGGKGEVPQGVSRVSPETVGQAFRGRLRKRETPYCLPVAGDVRMVERRMYMGAYKGVTDAITKYVWPVPAMWATRLCVRLGLRPNAVTSVGAVLMLLALWLFWRGDYGWGLLAAWIMTFLDTVDGKLARVTMTSSPLGNVFDHGIDLVHPPFWYLAWGIGLSQVGLGLPAGSLTPLMVVIFGGYILGRLCEGYFSRRFGLEVHIWRRFDSVFRLITARRNPNMVMLTLAWLLGRPDLGLIAVAAWTVLSDGVHLVQILQAEIAKARGVRIASWLRSAT
ncbi:CDP-alcohol phosphatidyltransferase family protein [Ferruginivarius sediminum]|nr:CDP-alcohol phosphatidyltransferase family protein [Ferruginivarius sediminum]